MSDRLLKLSQSLNYRFVEASYADIALTHRSFGEPHNERLEFLGDALLGSIIAEDLYQRFPYADEGQLTRMRAALVNKESLACVARTFKLGEFLLLGEGERKTGGWQRSSTLANAFEAVVGAIYLDGGLPACKKFVLESMSDRLSQLNIKTVQKDSKTALQELLQSRGAQLPCYEVVSAVGEPHERIFTVACRVSAITDEAFIASGSSRRKAEQSAAALALESVLQCL